MVLEREDFTHFPRFGSVFPVEKAQRILGGRAQVELLVVDGIRSAEHEAQLGFEITAVCSVDVPAAVVPTLDARYWFLVGIANGHAHIHIGTLFSMRGFNNRVGVVGRLSVDGGNVELIVEVGGSGPVVVIHDGKGRGERQPEFAMCILPVAGDLAGHCVARLREEGDRHTRLTTVVVGMPEVLAEPHASSAVGGMNRVNNIARETTMENMEVVEISQVHTAVSTHCVAQLIAVHTFIRVAGKQVLYHGKESGIPQQIP